MATQIDSDKLVELLNNVVKTFGFVSIKSIELYTSEGYAMTIKV